MNEETFDQMIERLEAEIVNEIEEIPEIQNSPFGSLHIGHRSDIIKVVTLTAIRAYQVEIKKRGYPSS